MVINLEIAKNATLKIKKGDQIDFDQDLYHWKKRNQVKLNIASSLKIKPESIFQHLVKIIGEQVKKGETVAVKKGLLSSRKVNSHLDGTLTDINHQTGEITIETEKEGAKKNDRKDKIIKSNFKGTVEEIKNNLLKIKIENGQQFDLRQANQDGGGEAFYFKDEEQYFTISLDEIGQKIVVIEELKSHLVTKCEALGCAGFLFLKSALDVASKTTFPFAKIKRIDDFKKIVELKKKYVIFSQADKILIAYD